VKGDNHSEIDDDEGKKKDIFVDALFPWVAAVNHEDIC
jgi:hypothetical protein